MNATVTSVNKKTVKIELTVTLSDSMLTSENNIQDALNEAGCLATVEALKFFDTDGSPIEIAGEKWTTKGQKPKTYQTPYGPTSLERHIYQRSTGGVTYCPIDHDAQIIITSTPRFAKQVSHKFANGSSVEVQRDLAENHHRKVTRCYIQDITEGVATIVQAKEGEWQYAAPIPTKDVKTIAIGMDGTCMLLCKDGYREAMAGTISLYDEESKRLHTIYVAASPEYGKATFFERMEREIEQIKAQYPDVQYLGIADGAAENWLFLKKHISTEILDFYHASEYITKAAFAAFPRSIAKRTGWAEAHCHQLKHEPNAADDILKDMKVLQDKTHLSESIKEKLNAAVTYFENHKQQMNYASYRKSNWPIGSGVTEAACKTLIKQRMCDSGMKWMDKGASIVLSLRSLVLTRERWTQFWNKFDQEGFSV